MLFDRSNHTAKSRLSDNVRQAPLRDVDVGTFVGPDPLPLSSGRWLSLYLFQAKTGDRQARARYEAIQRNFMELTGVTFEVVLERGDRTPDRSGDWQQGSGAPGQGDGGSDGQVRIGVYVRRDGLELPLSYCGAGVGEALYLSSLVSSDRRVIMLDEPALNLHPTTQLAFARALTKATAGTVGEEEGSQILLVTHSPLLVTPEAITRVSRFALNREGQTTRAALDPAGFSPGQKVTTNSTTDPRAEESKVSSPEEIGELTVSRNGYRQQEKTRFEALQKELRGSSDARALLFCRAAVLLEGETELGALPLWFEKRYGYGPEREAIALCSVGGDQTFEQYVRFLRCFQIPYVIVCDGPVIGPILSTPPQLCPTCQRSLRGSGRQPPRRYLDEQLRQAGIQEVQSLALRDFDERLAELARFGVFTTAERAEDEFDDLPVIAQHQQEAQQTVGMGSKVRIGRYVAEMRPCPDQVGELFKKIQSYIEAQQVSVPGP